MMVLTFILVMKFPILAYFLNYIVFNRSKKGGGGNAVTMNEGGVVVTPVLKVKGIILAS